MPEMLIDSVILIDHFNGSEQATEFILNLNPDNSVISVITRAEILVGFAEDELDVPKALLDQFKTLEIDKRIADAAAQFAPEISRPRMDISLHLPLVIDGHSFELEDIRDEG